jgi:hypothetical protein
MYLNRFMVQQNMLKTLDERKQATLHQLEDQREINGDNLVVVLPRRA